MECLGLDPDQAVQYRCGTNSGNKSVNQQNLFIQTRSNEQFLRYRKKIESFLKIRSPITWLSFRTVVLSF